MNTLRLWGMAGILVSLVMSSHAACADTLTIKADPWCPFNCDDSSQPGFVVEIARAVFEPLGHKIDYRTTDWKRAIALAREGEITGVVGAEKQDAPDLIYPDVEQGETKTCFFVKPSSRWRYSGIESLKEVTIGLDQQDFYPSPLDHYIPGAGAKVHIADGDYALIENLKLLKADKLGAVGEDSNIIQYLTDKGWIPSSITSAGCLTPDPVFIAFSPKDPKGAEYARILAKGTTELRASGKLKDILAKYHMTDWR